MKRLIRLLLVVFLFLGMLYIGGYSWSKFAHDTELKSPIEVYAPLWDKISHDVLSKYNLVVETLFSTNVDLDDEQIKKDIVDNASDVIEKKVLDVYQSEDSDEYYILKSVCEDSNI